MIVVYAGALELLRHARPAAFLAGVLLALLAPSALSGLSPSAVGSSDVRTSTSGMHPAARPGSGTDLGGSPVRAARMVEARSADAGMADQRDRASSTSSSSTDSARTTAIDETPASEAHHVPQASPPRQDPALVVATLRAAAVEFGVDPDRLVAIARCESKLDPLAVGAAGELGILQFKPATFRANAALLGYRIDQVFDVRAQARTAAAKIAREGAWAWSCAK